MFRPRPFLRAVCILLSLLSQAVCDTVSLKSQDPAPVLSLKVAVNDIYCKDTACSCVHHIASRQYAEFLSLLKQRYGIELEFVYFIEPYALSKAYRADQFDAFLCKPWLVMKESGPRRDHLARLADLQDPSGNVSLWGTVIVLKDAPLRSLADLKGKRVVIGQSDAYEKHQAALALFTRAKLTFPEAMLLQRASCLECIDLLLKAEVDAAVISNYALTADCAVDVTSPDQFRTLAATERLPLTSFIIDSRRLAPAQIKRLAEALLELSKSALPEGMSGGGFVAPVAWTPQSLSRN